MFIEQLNVIFAARGVTPDYSTMPIIQDNGDGPFIAVWDVGILGAVPTIAELDAVKAQAEAAILQRAKDIACDAVDLLRDIKKTLPILSEGEQVDSGTLSSGAMANELFAYDGKAMDVASITRSGDTATVVFDKNHHMNDAQSATFSGAAVGEYNDTFPCAVIDKRTVTFEILGSPATPAGGAITALPATFPWIDALNNDVFWSADKVKDIHRDTTKYERDCVQNARSLKNDVLSCDTAAEIDLIDITIGWPDTGL